MNILKKVFGFEADSLLPRRYRIIGIWMCVLVIPEAFLIDFLLREAFDLNSSYWNEWGLYILHLPLSVGLYFILFSKEKNEDELYLGLRLQSITRGVMMIVVAIALLPVCSNLGSLIIGRAVTLPDVGSNMAVCTLLLIYANGAYLVNKFRLTTDD